ncbi:hypothetical protein [Flammeovirga agarivorans]|uniref:Uncharacterized protein n=1 Tax=Flammeovirga agarivorans TaxID=2726742 RepID=A0A7X8SRJ7_9BACT|nr:hypothetical protein [Flammeovirga agarivorans]NLR95083.1 hypothetical protein [Flammeovirga agarivorans]
MSSDKDKLSFSERIELENRERLRKTLNEIPRLNCPKGWECQQFSVGGLTEIGFSHEQTNLLLAISSNGRGLFDCSTLQKIDRDYDQDHLIDYQKMKCHGIGILKNESLSIAGLHGGGLPVTSLNKDSLDVMALDWPNTELIFAPNGKSAYIEKHRLDCFRIYRTDSLKSYGFSICGNYFAIGTSSDLLIFKRKYKVHNNS